jgi:hypothetical protein
MKTTFLAGALLASAAVLTAQSAPLHWKFAPTPPLGWNSWDCFGTTITETQAKAQADAMARELLPSGYKYFTVDIQWYEPGAEGHTYKEGAPLAMDEYSRLLPAPNKFPSATNGAGFKPLADYVHAKGLQFGIHIMRGIPRQAAKQNTPIKGSTARAADIALTNHTCSWNPDMYGVDMKKPGAQEYYDSLFQLYASWGVDFVKCDDISRAYDSVQKAEIEAIHKAIAKTGRPIVLSLSPGDTPIARGEHVMNHANMWRISDDFWDRWEPLYGMLGRLDKWTKYRAEGAWPDADMLPFGIVEFTRPTRFTKNEQVFCMSLWCIARSPLIFGGDVTKLDAFTRGLLTNPEVLAVNQASTGNRQLSRQDDLVVWAAAVPDSRDRYVAFFNAQNNNAPFDLSKTACQSRVIRGAPGSEVVQISVPATNAHRLVLVLADGGDGPFYDHGAWIEPTLSGPKGSLKLTSLNWVQATTGWGEARVNRTVDDQPLTLNGQPVDGIGTHAASVIEYDNLPEGYDTFTARGVITSGNQGKGSIQFKVLVDPPKKVTPEQSPVSVSFTDLGITGPATVRDLWSRENLGTFTNRFTHTLSIQSAGLYRISPQP